MSSITGHPEGSVDDRTLDAALERLRVQGHDVRIIGPFANGHRLIEVDEIVRNYHEIMALAQDEQEVRHS